MIVKDSETKRRLVALARKKAERHGTTLEAKVEFWLAEYVSEPDSIAIATDDERIASRGSTPRATSERTVTLPSRASSPIHSGSDTRSEAYRRLQGVMSHSSRRTP